MTDKTVFDEELNVALTDMAYVIAEKRILKAHFAKLYPSDPEAEPSSLFDNLDLKEILADCFEEAMEFMNT